MNYQLKKDKILSFKFNGETINEVWFNMFRGWLEFYNDERNLAATIDMSWYDNQTDDNFIESITFDMVAERFGDPDE
jgi:hypothetical protein